MRYANGSQISPDIVRQVWARVSSEPQIPIRALAQSTGHSSHTIGVALHTLREAGYITFKNHTRKTRVVIVPLIEVTP